MEWKPTTPREKLLAHWLIAVLDRQGGHVVLEEDELATADGRPLIFVVNETKTHVTLWSQS